MKDTLMMFTTTLGSAAVIAALAMIYYSIKARSELHKKNKTAHAFLTAAVFGLLAIYGSVSAVEVSGALCNCRTLAPLYAGLVAGPIAGIIAGVIGGLFRYFVYGGDAAIACCLACILAGVIGSLFHMLIRKKYRYTIPFGIVASVITEVCHLGIVWVFGFEDFVKAVALPIILANVCGMVFCLYMYQRCNPNPDK